MVPDYNANFRTIPVYAKACLLGVLLFSVSCVRNGPVPVRLHQDEVLRQESGVRAAFGPDCEPLVIEALKGARKDILVAAYSITRKKIVSELARAVRRQVTVKLKYDARQTEWEGMADAIAYLRKAGIECIGIERAGEYAKMHHKFMVIDGVRVLTGSFNYTTSAATANDENIVLIESPEIATEFAREFSALKSR